MEGLMDGIKESFLKEFPKGYIKAWISTSSGSDKKLIAIDIGLIDSVLKIGNGGLQCDPMYHRTLVYDMGDGIYTAVLVIGGLMIRSDNPLYIMNQINTKFKKTNGNDEKILKMYKQFFKKLKVTVKKQNENVWYYKLYKDYI